MRYKFIILGIIVMSLALVPTPAFALTSKDIEKELMCQCGCTMVVDVCDCETANQIREKIAGMIGQGQDKGQIVAYFVGQYGEKMLAAPTKKGFNLVAWVVPFAAVLVGGTGLFFILQAWVRKGRKTDDQGTVLAQPVTLEDTTEYRGRLEAELRRFREEGL